MYDFYRLYDLASSVMVSPIAVYYLREVVFVIVCSLSVWIIGKIAGSLPGARYIAAYACTYVQTNRTEIAQTVWLS